MLCHALVDDWLIVLGFNDTSTLKGWRVVKPLRVILCRLPEKGRKETEEIVEEMKERTGKKVEQEWKWRNRRNKNSPSTLTYYKDSSTCPTVSQYQLDAPVM